MKNKGVPVSYIRVIKDMYDGVRARARNLVGVMDDFSIGIGFYQWSTLSSVLFTIIMDELTRGIQDKTP